MPRANRHAIKGQVWHLTHRCHQRQWLLRFGRDRRRWQYWLFQAIKRFGLVVLNYMVTSNHIHLLVQDQGRNEISRSMQLIAGRTAQEFNYRKRRKGAFWDDRYHATAVQTGNHLARCIRYIDLNMVRAGVVQHPEDWQWSGYYELQHPRQRAGRINVGTLLQILEEPDLETLQRTVRSWSEAPLENGKLERESKWSEAVMVGDEEFIKGHYSRLNLRYPGLKIGQSEGSFILREQASSYNAISHGKKCRLSAYTVANQVKICCGVVS